LNDYELAKAICTTNIPVLTGIGHERDNTILDEVSNIRFDTPSKVAAGIEQVIKWRVEEAKANFALLTNFATRTMNNANSRLDRDFAAIQSGAVRQVATAKQHSQALMSEVRHETHQQLSEAKREAPALFSEIRVEASNALKTARTLTATRLDAIRDRAAVDVLRCREAVKQEFSAMSTSARRAIADAKQSSQALVLEVTGQGPQKTLGRGFAIVRDEQGKPITLAASAKPGVGMEIEFRDGRLAAQAR
jgi:exodeoxyribonuclease VII large subunit